MQPQVYSHHRPIPHRVVARRLAHECFAVKDSCDHEHDEAGGDDMCTDLLPAGNRADAVYSDGLTEGEDMGLLLSCDGAIVTAGSYGWWGGFLTGGDVVAFGTPYSGKLLDHWNKDDFFPPGWVLFDGDGHQMGGARVGTYTEI